MVVVERRELPILDFELVITPGAEQDRPAQAGRTAMLAELLDEGTATRSALQIAEEIDYLGADLSVRPGWDALSVSLRVLSERFEPALDVVADCVVNASFPGEEYERKKRERLATLLLERDEPHLLAGKALAAGVFGATHPFGAPVLGTHASISRLECADVHTLFQERVHAGHAFITVVGDVVAADVVAALAARFGAWHGGRSLPPVLPPVPAAPARRVLLIDKPGAAQAELRVGHAAPARTTPDYFTIKVLNTILGGSFTARLNAILRERMGVTYGAHSRFRMRCHAGVFTAGAAVATTAVARSAQVIIAEMERLRVETVGAEELQRAQNYIAFGLPRRFESNEDVADHLRERLLYDLPADYWETYVDRIFAVTADDVRAAAVRHLQPDTSVLVVVAEQAAVRAALENANLGEVMLTEVQP